MEKEAKHLRRFKRSFASYLEEDARPAKKARKAMVQDESEEGETD